MVQLKGRVLKAPELEYANKQLCRPQKGAWDMGRGGYMFKKSVDLNFWAIVSLDDRTGHKHIKEFVYALQDQAERAGFDIDNPKKAYSANRPQEVCNSKYQPAHDIFWPRKLLSSLLRLHTISRAKKDIACTR